MEWDGEKANLLVTRDITEKLETSKRLEESQTRYSRLIDASPDAICVHVDGLIVFANAAAATLFGAASAEDLLGLNGEIIFREDDKSLRTDLSHALKKREENS